MNTSSSTGERVPHSVLSLDTSTKSAKSNVVHNSANSPSAMAGREKAVRGRWPHRVQEKRAPRDAISAPNTGVKVNPAY
jgi:hypothetical protein